MLATLKARLAEREHDQEGFTLIELMVVVLIIAILIAIAIPTFLGARQKAQDRAAQSDIRNALTAAKTGYVDGQSYVSAALELSSVEPSLQYALADGASTSPSQISVFTDAVTPIPGVIGLASQAKDNTCWMLWESTDASQAGGAGTFFGHGTGACKAPTSFAGLTNEGATW